MLIDAHLHIAAEELKEVKILLNSGKFRALANASSHHELQMLSPLVTDGLYISYGIHPWEVKGGAITEEDMINFGICRVIGEIGMDSQWCNCDLDVQRDIFIKQLEIAQNIGKPVLLHTKGQERQIAEILKSYSVKKLVHWYSCEEYLDMYIEQDCYFSIGPDFEENPAVQRIIKEVPTDRLLVETDGTAAVEWALGKACNPREISQVLSHAILAAAKEKNMPYEGMRFKMEQNFYDYISSGCTKSKSS